jgi:hypothetical protein
MVAKRLSKPILALLICHSALTLLGQSADHQAVPTILFNQQDVHPISTFPFSSSSVQCDARGNAFFDLVGQTVESGDILRVSADDQNVNPVRLPTDLGKDGEWHYSVASDGKLYAIFSEASDHRLIELSPSNEELRRTTLQLPRYFHVHSFAVLPGGNLMVAGSVPMDETSTVRKESPLLVWLAPDGRVLRQESQGATFDPASVQSECFIAAGRLDTFIATNGSIFEVFSARGELIQTFPFSKPSPESWVSGLSLADAHVAIEFSRPVTTAAIEGVSASESGKAPGPYFGPLTQTWLLANAVNGEAEAFYEMPPDFVGSALCYLGGHEFLYFQVKNEKPILLRATTFP